MKTNKKYKHVLIDLDDTLLDFKKAEQYAFNQLLNLYQIKDYDKYFYRYREINIKLWAEFEQGLISKDKLAIYRFEQTFVDCNIKLDFRLLNEQFLMFISTASFPIEGSYQLLKYLKSKYRVYIVSNGIKDLQILRLNHSRMMELIDGYAFSEEANVPKPHLSYFNYLFEKYQLTFNQDEFIIIGDSLTSDIQGANNLGIDSIWFNPNQALANIKSTFEVNQLTKIIELL